MWVQSLDWEDPLRREWLPTAVFLSGEFHGQRSLAGYSPWGGKELDTMEWLHFFHGPYSVSNHFKLVASFFNWDFYVKIWISGCFWKNRKSGLHSPDLPQSLPLSIVFPTLRSTVSHHLSLCLSCCFTYFALWGKQKQSLGPILFLSKGRRRSQKRMEAGVKKSAGLI